MNKTMRPDEHKKKQRADYKKKHGISNKKTPLKERNETPKDGNSTQDQEKDVLGETEEVKRSSVLSSRSILIGREYER